MSCGGDPAAATSTSTSGAKSAPGGACTHGLPADLCTHCNPDLVPVFKAAGDWCGQHDVPKSLCKQCDPTLALAPAATPADWCKEHGLPESKCTKCSPSLVAKFIEAGDYCREHGFPKSVCPRCDPEGARQRGGAPPEFPAPGTKVRLASADAVREAGIMTAVAQKKRAARTIEVVGELSFNQNRLAQLSARGEAMVLEVRVDVGEVVKAGQPLVVLASGDVGGHQARLAASKVRLEAAQARVEREGTLSAEGIGSQKSLHEARSDLATAQSEHAAALASLRAAGASSGGSGGQYALSAPFGGVVVSRQALAGKGAVSGETLVEVADVGTLWALLEVPEEHALAVRPEQRVTLSFEGLRGVTREGKVVLVSPTIDSRTRTVRARVDIPNADGGLKAGLFVRAQIQVSPEREALFVPRDALQDAEGQALVFVKTGDALFEPRRVRAGEAVGEEVEITEGLDAGAAVVTTGAFLLKTEILKEAIGAGCCEVEE